MGKRWGRGVRNGVGWSFFEAGGFFLVEKNEFFEDI